MSFAARLSQCPRPFDPDRGKDALEDLTDVPPALRELLFGAASCSPYLHDLLKREGDWLGQAVEAPEETLRAALVFDWRAGTVAEDLRQAKRRVALLTGLADLGGIWSLEEVTGALTKLADAAVDAALRAALWPLIKRRKLPGLDEERLEGDPGIFVLAMGKMGAFELNYSSDIDLICLFDEAQFDPDDYADLRSGFARGVRQMCAILSDTKAGGYVFRTDLRLRPDPSVTPVVLSTGAAERYYESLGRTWERAAYIKARVCAGDIAAGECFLEEMQPFVWRKHLDFTAIEDAHNIRLAIRENKGLGGPITLPGHDMKLGRGGIREIEFFTQTRQLIAGGRDSNLRQRGTIPALLQLTQAGWVKAKVSEQLADHYRFHRTVEHRVQMVRDAQTHNLPTNPEEMQRLAAMMDLDVDVLETGVVFPTVRRSCGNRRVLYPQRARCPKRDEGRL